VLRFRIVKLRPGTPPPPDLRATAPVTGSTGPDEDDDRDRDRDRGRGRDRDRDRDRG
jgi:hypothetical protein